MDYNMFSPYTPIPYHSIELTKFTHAHIDIVGFLNEKQLNVNDSYLSDFLEPHDRKERKLNNWHDPYGLHHHGEGHGHH